MGHGAEYRSQGLVYSKHTCSIVCHLKAHKLAMGDFIVKCTLSPDMVVHAFNPSNQRQEDLWEFQAILVYIVSSQPARALSLF